MSLEIEHFNDPEYMIGNGKDLIIGRDHKMKDLYLNMNFVSETSASVLIMGATGTGKELCAQALHYNNPLRVDNSFIRVNCAAVPESLLEDELFGHVSGAFTGAKRNHQGVFERANGGTVFFDEISEMPLGLQAKMLRVLQEGYITPVGGEDAQKVDVRVISATNKNIGYEIDQGNFREDLYHRLNEYPLELPLLCERREDIPLIADSIREKYNKLESMEVTRFTRPAMKELKGKAWSGNVRELENVIHRSMILKRRGELDKGEFFYSREMPKGQRLRSILKNSKRD